MTHTLKAILQTELVAKIDRLEAALAETWATLSALPLNDMDTATFVVALSSLWANEGEDSTETTHVATLEEAILVAEREFMRHNRRSDVQASYSVYVQVGAARLDVPESVFAEYLAHRRR